MRLTGRCGLASSWKNALEVASGSSLFDLPRVSSRYAVGDLGGTPGKAIARHGNMTDRFLVPAIALTLGLRLMEEKNHAAAVTVFERNAEAYPYSSQIERLQRLITNDR